MWHRQVQAFPVLDGLLPESREVMRLTAGRVVFCGATVPGSVADITPARDSGLAGVLVGSGARVLADAGYQGLNADTAGALITPPAS